MISQTVKDMMLTNEHTHTHKWILLKQHTIAAQAIKILHHYTKYRPTCRREG